MRIAVLAPIAWRVPPRHYGPWEQFASLLTEGLVDRGFDVTLFAAADSVTRARLVGTVPVGYAEDATVDAKVSEALHIAAAFERADEFDLIHNGFDFLPLSFSRLVNTPVVTTIHGFSSEQILPVYERFGMRMPVIYPRKSVTLIDGAPNGLGVADVFRDVGAFGPLPGSAYAAYAPRGEPQERTLEIAENEGLADELLDRLDLDDFDHELIGRD